MMRVDKTTLDGVLLITPPTIFEDFRGNYIELYNEELYRQAGIEQVFLQDDISTSRRHTRSMKFNTRSSSAWEGGLASGFESGALATGASSFTPPGNASPRASSSFLRAAFSLCKRPISLSSAVRSLGTSWHDQPVVLHRHCETWPVRVSSRMKWSRTWKNE